MIFQARTISSVSFMDERSSESDWGILSFLLQLGLAPVIPRCGHRCAWSLKSRTGAKISPKVKFFHVRGGDDLLVKCKCGPSQ